jgi:hypothetical protein
MSARMIGLIYLYVVSGASLALLVVGIFNAVNLLVNLTQFDKYPLRYGGMEQCEDHLVKAPFMMERGMSTAPAIAPGPKESTPSAEEMKEWKDRCIRNSENERVQHKVEDMKNAITPTLVGLILFLIHFPMARRQSKSE